MEIIKRWKQHFQGHLFDKEQDEGQGENIITHEDRDMEHLLVEQLITGI